MQKHAAAMAGLDVEGPGLSIAVLQCNRSKAVSIDVFSTGNAAGIVALGIGSREQGFVFSPEIRNSETGSGSSFVSNCSKALTDFEPRGLFLRALMPVTSIAWPLPFITCNMHPQSSFVQLDSLCVVFVMT